MVEGRGIDTHRGAVEGPGPAIAPLGLGRGLGPGACARAFALTTSGRAVYRETVLDEMASRASKAARCTSCLGFRV